MLEIEIIKLHLAESLNYQAKLQICRFINEEKYFPSPSECQSFLKVPTEQLKSFFLEFHSQKLAEKVKNNLRHTSALTILDEAYPKHLLEIYQPPLVLFYHGDLTLLKQPGLAVVGSRVCSDQAPLHLHYLLKEVCRQNITIISGLARGIDTIAHQTALAHHGTTVAICGNGLGHYYPRENEQLQNFIAQRHLLLSEYDWHEPPLPFHFPERNRIIAGLAQAVLVAEAKERSGSLITANLALQENRSVLAIPGSLFQSLSQGCNRLIQAGAKPVLTPEDIIEEFATYLTN